MQSAEVGIERNCKKKISLNLKSSAVKGLRDEEYGKMAVMVFPINVVTG